MIYILLAAYNEERNLPGLLEEIRAQDWTRPHRVVLVDDGSTDSTKGKAVQRAGGMDLVVLEHPVNRGLGAALSTGFAYLAAEIAPGDLLVTMDADQTHPVSLIFPMMREIEAGSDVVIASRFCEGGRQFGLAFTRRLVSSLASALLRRIWPAGKARDYTSGYRAFSGKIVRSLTERYGGSVIEEKGFAATLELLLKASRLTGSISEVPLELHYERKKSASKMRVFKTMREYALLLARMRFDKQPGCFIK